MVSSLKTISIKKAPSQSDTVLCIACKGHCCKQLPGGLIPSDVLNGLPETELSRLIKELLMSGRYALDWWETDSWKEGFGNSLEAYLSQSKEQLSNRAYFLRPAIKGDEGKVFDPSWGGECTFLEPTGCSLSPSNRPYECSILRPKPALACDYAPELNWQGKRSLVAIWNPYNDILEKAGNEIDAA